MGDSSGFAGCAQSSGIASGGLNGAAPAWHREIGARAREICRKGGIIAAFGMGRSIRGFLRPFIASEHTGDEQNGERLPRDEDDGERQQLRRLTITRFRART